MSTSTNILPVSAYTRWRMSHLSANRPPACRVEGLTDDGLLIRFDNTGSLAVWTGRALRTVDQARSEEALSENS